MTKNILSQLPLLLMIFLTAEAQSFLGVNYGDVADNLPPPEATAKLLKTTPFSKVRLYGADQVMIKALANTDIGITIGAANGDIPALASDPSHATQWVKSNVLDHYPASKIILITVGNEVISSGDQNLISQLVPAMQNIQDALNSAKLGGKIRVSTVHSMAVMGQSDPPSSGSFNPDFGDTMKKLLEFQKENGSPLTINPYPFFAYQSDPRPDTLAFCLFKPNAGRVDPGTNIKYMNMFDAQVDAIHSALSAMGFKDIEIVVAETGWPYRGDSNEVGPSIENAKAYNGGLISHLRSMVGTPLMPGKSVDTYIFALYDEDLKPGAASEKSFGLFKPDLSMTYDLDLSKSNTTQAPTTTPSRAPETPSTSSPAPSTTPTAGPSPNKTSGTWCVPKKGVSDVQLQANLDYACGQGVDCSKIRAGGPCHDPNTVASHAAYAMNLLYQAKGRSPGSCDFTQTATVTSTNPSYGSCVYPGDGKTRVSLGVGMNKNSAATTNFSMHWFWLWCLCFLFLP